MPKLTFKYASMNSGKTSNLIQTAYNFRESGKRVEILTSVLDDRYGKNKVSSRIGISMGATPINSETDIKKLVTTLIDGGKIDAILVDESQFLTKKQIVALGAIVDYGNITVICYGIKTYFEGKMFEGSKTLFEIADTLVHMKSVCSNCTETANFNARITNETDQVLVGGNETYIPMCRKCFNKHTLCKHIRKEK